MALEERLMSSPPPLMWRQRGTGFYVELDRDPGSHFPSKPRILSHAKGPLNARGPQEWR